MPDVEITSVTKPDWNSTHDRITRVGAGDPRQMAARTRRYNSVRDGEATGEPPARGCDSTERAVRQHPTHRANVRWSTSNSAASCPFEPEPRSYAITACFRSATLYGFGMASFNYTPLGDTSGNRD